jgi:hypothetical protein
MNPMSQSQLVQDVKSITINGVEYVRADSVTAPSPKPGKRAVVVVDRGWIFAGDVTEENGRIKLTRAVHVFSWSGQGFAAMIADPTKKTDIRSCADVDLPADSEIFRVPVHDNWGIK